MSKGSRSTKVAGRSAKGRMAPEIGHAGDKRFADHRFNKKLLGEDGVLVCTGCTAISSLKHWYIDPDRYKLLMKKSQYHPVLCPGCKRVEQHAYDGQVVLEGPLLKDSRDEVMALIKHTEGKAWHDNPISRIASIDGNGTRIEILTTTKWLAQRIGKQFQKAFKGKLEIKPAPREKFVRVYWKQGK